MDTPNPSLFSSPPRSGWRPRTRCGPPCAPSPMVPVLWGWAGAQRDPWGHHEVTLVSGATTDAEAWQRLWTRSRLVLHAEAQALTCSLSSPCDLPAELIPCWQPAPTGPCQELPGLRHPAMGQVSGLHGAPGALEGYGGTDGASLPPTGIPGAWGAAATPQPLCASRTPLCPTAALWLPHGHPSVLLTRSLR